MLGASPTLESNYWFGAQGNRLWVGQVEGDGAKTITGDECVDYQESNRVKVRIMGYHTRSRSQLKPLDLPWASVLMPTTETITRHSAGTVHGLENGMWVLGTFMDGESAQQPLVMGSIGIVDKRQETYTDRYNNLGLSNDYEPRSPELVKNMTESSGGHGQSNRGSNTGTISAQTTDTCGNLPVAGSIDQLRFGSYYNESNISQYPLDSGHIKRFSYWPVRLTNAQLTTYIS